MRDVRRPATPKSVGAVIATRSRRTYCSERNFRTSPRLEIPDDINLWSRSILRSAQSHLAALNLQRRLRKIRPHSSAPAPPCRLKSVDHRKQEPQCDLLEQSPARPALDPPFPRRASCDFRMTSCCRTSPSAWIRLSWLDVNKRLRARQFQWRQRALFNLCPIVLQQLLCRWRASGAAQRHFHSGSPGRSTDEPRRTRCLSAVDRRADA